MPVMLFFLVVKLNYAFSYKKSTDFRQSLLKNSFQQLVFYNFGPTIALFSISSPSSTKTPQKEISKRHPLPNKTLSSRLKTPLFSAFLSALPGGIDSKTAAEHFWQSLPEDSFTDAEDPAEGSCFSLGCCYLGVGQNPGTPVNIPKAFKIDYLGRVTNPKKALGFDPQPFCWSVFFLLLRGPELNVLLRCLLFVSCFGCVFCSVCDGLIFICGEALNCEVHLKQSSNWSGSDMLRNQK